MKDLGLIPELLVELLETITLALIRLIEIPARIARVFVPLEPHDDAFIRERAAIDVDDLGTDVDGVLLS